LFNSYLLKKSISEGEEKIAVSVLLSIDAFSIIKSRIYIKLRVIKLISIRIVIKKLIMLWLNHFRTEGIGCDNTMGYLKSKRHVHHYHFTINVM